MTKAETIIRQAINDKLTAILSELETLDGIFEKLGAKGTTADINIRTAAIALNVAAAML